MSPFTPVEDAVAQFASILTLKETPESTMRMVVSLTKATVSGCDGVGLTVVTPQGFETAAYTDEWVIAGDVIQYQVDDGPCLEGIRSNRMMVTHDLAAETRWKPFPERVVPIGLRSVLTVPLSSGDIQIGGLNIYARSPNVFDDTSEEIASLLGKPATAAIANVNFLADAVKLSDQLKEAMESRAVIEQAKGVLIATRNCTAEEAFAHLKAASQRSNRKLRDIAAEIVDNFSGGSRTSI